MGQSHVPHAPPASLLEHTALLKVVYFKEREHGFAFGLGHLSQGSSREEGGSQHPERQECVEVRVWALEPDFLCLHPGSRVYDLGM